jgi:hypothetical protein
VLIAFGFVVFHIPASSFANIKEMRLLSLVVVLSIHVNASKLLSISFPLTCFLAEFERGAAAKRGQSARHRDCHWAAVFLVSTPQPSGPTQDVPVDRTVGRQRLATPRA